MYYTTCYQIHNFLGVNIITESDQIFVDVLAVWSLKI